jgi:four helix bundle protein
MADGRAESDYAPRYRQLKAWQICDDLAVDAYKLARRLPRDEYSLKDQIIRAAVSAPANIAEGYGRGSNKEFAQSLVVAHGSLYEVDYFLHFLNRIELLEAEKYAELATECRHASRLTFGLLRAARSDSRGKETQQRYLREEPAPYEFNFE